MIIRTQRHVLSRKALLGKYKYVQNFHSANIKHDSLAKPSTLHTRIILKWILRKEAGKL